MKPEELLERLKEKRKMAKKYKNKDAHLRLKEYWQGVYDTYDKVIRWVKESDK